MRHVLTGFLALLLAAGAVALTGMFLAGKVKAATARAYAEFGRCGQGLREGGDVKLRGVLVGRIGALEASPDATCLVALELFPGALDEIPANIGAQIRAKTVFGEKWVELLYPTDPFEERIAAGDKIHLGRTIDPLEVETILNLAVPLLDAVDPERLSSALEALARGFSGHEEAAARAIRAGVESLEPLNEKKELIERGIDQLRQASAVLEDVDDDLLASLDNLIEVNRFTTANDRLIEENLRKAPLLLRELSTLFETRLFDLTELVNQGATVISIVSARADDLDRLLEALPAFSSGWIRNLNHTCPYRQVTTEPGKEVGEKVPGRCWRVHNILAESRGAYEEGEEPRPELLDAASYEASGISLPADVGRILYAPTLHDGGTR